MSLTYERRRQTHEVQCMSVARARARRNPALERTVCVTMACLWVTKCRTGAAVRDALWAAVPARARRAAQEGLSRAAWLLAACMQKLSEDGTQLFQIYIAVPFHLSKPSLPQVKQQSDGSVRSFFSFLFDLRPAQAGARWSVRALLRGGEHSAPQRAHAPHLPVTDCDMPAAKGPRPPFYALSSDTPFKQRPGRGTGCDRAHRRVAFRRPLLFRMAGHFITSRNIYRTRCTHTRR